MPKTLYVKNLDWNKLDSTKAWLISIRAQQQRVVIGFKVIVLSHMLWHYAGGSIFRVGVKQEELSKRKNILMNKNAFGRFEQEVKIQLDKKGRKSLFPLFFL